MHRLVTMAAMALALVAPSSRADDFCAGVSAALAQPHGFDGYKGAPSDEDKTLGLTTWPSPVRLAGARDCQVMYDSADEDTTFMCDFALPEATTMADFQRVYFDRVSACLPGVHAFHFDLGQKRVDYLEVTTGTIVLADDSVDHQSLTLLVQHADTP